MVVEPLRQTDGRQCVRLPVCGHAGLVGTQCVVMLEQSGAVNQCAQLAERLPNRINQCVAGIAIG